MPAAGPVMVLLSLQVEDRGAGGGAEPSGRRQEEAGSTAGASHPAGGCLPAPACLCSCTHTRIPRCPRAGAESCPWPHCPGPAVLRTPWPQCPHARIGVAPSCARVGGQALRRRSSLCGPGLCPSPCLIAVVRSDCCSRCLIARVCVYPPVSTVPRQEACRFAITQILDRPLILS